MRDVHGQFKSIKALVFDFVRRHDGNVNYDTLTAEVLEHFPTSEWKPSHWSYWRYQILHGKSGEQFSELERGNLEAGKGKQGRKRGPERKRAETPRANKALSPGIERIFPNRISEEEHNIAFSLARVCHHVHPNIVSAIRTANTDLDEKRRLDDIVPQELKLREWMYEGSACVFPGVRRFVGRLDPKELLKYVPQIGCIIDDNRFPRYLWTYIATGGVYNGSRWKESGLTEFELAHIFSHKPNKRGLEERVFENFDASQSPHGLFTCAANVVLIPKGFAKPTDGLPAVQIAFYKRHIELYGEDILPGLRGLKEDELPDWYEELEWNEPILPDNWEQRVQDLLKYRCKRLQRLFTQRKGE